MSEAKSYADARDNFQNQLTATKNAAANSHQALCGLAQRKQHEVEKNGWDGNLFNITSDVFDRSENTADVETAIKDVTAPGVSGDLTVSCLQGDYLASMERAFRLRHSTSIRRQLHAAARRKGHGDETGVLIRGVLDMVIGNILKQSKE